MEYDILFIIGLVFIIAGILRTKSKSTDEEVKTLYRQSARYAVASLQDDSDVIRTLHANYAMGYLMATKDIVNDTDFERITGVDRIAFENRIAGIQDVATKRLVRDRPELVPLNDKILLEAIYSA